MAESLSLQQAIQKILQQISPLPSEEIPLSEALYRRPSETLKALLPVPHFRQSTMDGYAVHSADLRDEDILPVTGEIPAGCTDMKPLPAGQAIRIMTGGVVPPGADRVIPQEHCRKSKEGIFIPHMEQRRKNIRACGADLKKGQVIIRKGDCLEPGHLQFLATSGYTSLPVFRQPAVAFLCTGSELVDTNPLPGQLISGNRALISSLIQQAKALPVDLGTAVDNTHIIAEKIRQAGPAQIIITTGGMGPGKYDLIGEVCSEMGIKPLYRSLNVRPGRATLFGVKDSLLFFALPGPPPAAHVLFQELVKPAILALQGNTRQKTKTLTARLQEEITIRKRGLLNLKSAILYVHNGNLCVRQNNTVSKPPNAVICIPANRRKIKKGEMVRVHPYDSLYSTD